MSFENTVEKREIACYEQSLLFPPFLQTFHHFCHIWNFRLQTISIWEGLNLLFGKDLTLSWKSVQLTILNLMKMAEGYPYGEKTMREKEKLLVTSYFSFSHSVFKILVLQTRKNQGMFWKGLTFSETSPGFCVSVDQVFWKCCGKRRNCSKPAISPFPTIFSTRLKNLLPFSSSQKLLSANSLSFEESKICCLGKG